MSYHKKKYIWETGDIAEDCVPIITTRNSPLNAAHLVPLEVKIKQDNKKIYVKRLKSKFPLDDLKLDKFIAKNLGRLYTANLVAIWTQRCNPSLIGLPFLEEHEDTENSNLQSEWMCSQLVVCTLKEMGIIGDIDENTNSFTPGDLFEDIDTSVGFSYGDAELVYMK